MTTKVFLQYRDASNYKTQPVPVIFAGDPTPELIARLIARLEDPGGLNSGSLIAEQVGLEQPSFGGVYEDDHCWTEIEIDPEPCTAQATDDRTFAEFVAEVEAIEEWDDTGGPVAELVDLFTKHPPLDESQEAERVEHIKAVLLNSFSGAFSVDLPQALYDIAHGRSRS